MFFGAQMLELDWLFLWLAYINIYRYIVGTIILFCGGSMMNEKILCYNIYAV